MTSYKAVSDSPSRSKSTTAIVPKTRSSNPDGLDGDKYVQRICKILHNLEPTKYAFFAGISAPQESDKELKYLKPGKRQPFIKPTRLSIDGSKAPSISETTLQTATGEIIIANTEEDIGEYYQDTTPDFVKRSIRNSLELQVTSNCEEMIKLVNSIASADAQYSDRSPHTKIDEFIASETTSQLESRCLQLFHAWVGRSKLGLGYLFHLTNHQKGWGDEFITKIVRHLAPRIEELPTEEIVTLMLMIFFRRETWSEDDLYEILDPTFLQKRLSTLMDSTIGITDAELCAICLGLRKVKGFTANIDEFRDALYRRLANIGNILSSEKAFSLDVEHISALNMAVIQISVLLQQGYHMGTRDPAKHILGMLKAYEEAVIAYNETAIEHESLSEGKFLMETRAAVKIMMFGSSKGGLHNKEVTEKVVERLILGKHIRHLSLRDLVSFLKFLSQGKEFGTLLKTDEYDITDIAKSTFNEIREITEDNDECQSCHPVDVMFILQSWLYLALFEQFDLVNIQKIMNAINELPDDVFQSNCTLPSEEQNISLGRILADTCYQTLFPKSYSALHSSELFKSHTLEPKELSQFSRLISSLDRSMKIYLQPTHMKGILLSDNKIRRLINLNQSQVPVIVYEKTKLPATLNLTRRQQLLYAVHKGLLTALDGKTHLKILHILPHFREPDIVFGHIAGNMISVPPSLTDAPEHDIKPAPEIGEWTVISLDHPSMTARELEELASTTEFSPQHANPERKRQLMRLGYQIYPLSAHEQKQLIRSDPTTWAELRLIR